MAKAPEHDRTVESRAAEEAAEWLVRLENPDPKSRAEFADWLRKSQLHRREILLATCWDHVLSALDPDHKIDIDELASRAPSNIVDLATDQKAMPRIAVPADKARSHWFQLPWFAMVGTLTAAVLLAFLTGLYMDRLFAQRFVTSIGEQRAIRLPDGSIAHLNAQSHMRVAYSASTRDLYLRDGQAMFKVRHDVRRPFRIHVEDTVIEAVGTQFDVRHFDGSIEVSVIEGRVRVKDESHPEIDVTELSAGDAVTITAGGRLQSRRQVEPSDVRAWQERRLVFRDRTLAEIVAEFNRYNLTPQLRFDDAELAQQRFSGVFDADDPDSLLDYLRSTEQVAVEHSGKIVVLRSHTQAKN